MAAALGACGLLCSVVLVAARVSQRAAFAARVACGVLRKASVEATCCVSSASNEDYDNKEGLQIED